MKPKDKKYPDITSTATCEKCRQRSTWGGPSAGRKLVWCPRCQETTYHIFMTNKEKP